MIEPYHGSNVEIVTIDLDKCNPNKDFFVPNYFELTSVFINFVF